MTRIKFLFDREEPLAFLSHLDLVRLLTRALRRAGLPLAYSKGFNPHPKLAFALPLPLGVLAENEPAEVYFSKPVKAEQFLEKLAHALPTGFVLKYATTCSLEEPAPGHMTEAALYRAEPATLELFKRPFSEEWLKEAVDQLLAKEEVLTVRTNKKGQKIINNVRPAIIKAEVNKVAGGSFALKFFLKAGSRGGVSPLFLLEQLVPEDKSRLPAAGCWKIRRQGLFTKNGQLLLSLPEGM